MLFFSKHAFSSVAVDSRFVQPGALFFALKGEKTDGHHFLEEVAKKGATAAVVSREYQGSSFGLTLVKVDDVLAHLQQMAKVRLKELPIRVVGVTGSLGKTTTKEFIASLLGEKYRVVKSPGNYNSQIGLPLTILNHIEGDEEILVQEMAMTHAGQIASLVSIAPPEVAVITNVALVHACNFATIGGIAQAKGEIFSHPKTKLGILNRNMPHFDEVEKLGVCKKLSFSLSDSILGEIPVPGVHNRENALAAIAVARYFGIDEPNLQKLKLPKGRFERVEKEGVIYFNDSYNASEGSVKAAIAALPKPKGGKTIAVLGEMLELGAFSEMCHREVAEVALEVVDEMICFGEACQPIVECFRKRRRKVELFLDFEEVKQALEKSVCPGDVVLVKGSNSKKLWRLFSDCVSN